MKYIFSALLFIHGGIYLMGFLKACKLAQIEQLTADISKISGIFWLLAFILFMTSGIAYLAKADWWYIFAFIAVLLSTILVFIVWQDAKFGIIANVIILIIAIVGCGTSKFHGKYESDVKTGLKQTTSVPESVLTEKDIEQLPEQVKKYIRYSGSIGKPKVNNFRLEFTGQIRKNEQSEWMPFTSVQYNFMEASTRHFFMKAFMKKLPVAGYHCFINGTAFMDIRLFSLFKVQYQSGEEMGISETVTFFNDMCCMAPGTLIDRRVKWLETDGNNIKAEFTNNNITISAWLYFNDKGGLINFISDDRYAAGENNSMQRLRWSTPLKDVNEVDGYRLAKYAEAVYSYPEGDLCYGTFNLTHVKYNCKDLK
ncbi:MAG: hypothetical protein EPN88_00080 [Bacteroidetes bacterium]|nr:MAG: hypothetical protein EPN88_00080 [Bacteroidota bacterium]